jgi:hypothetical protein
MNDPKRQIGVKAGLVVAMHNQEQKKKTRKGLSFLHFAFLGLSLLSIPVSAAPWMYDFAQGLDPLFWTTENDSAMKTTTERLLPGVLPGGDMSIWTRVSKDKDYETDV